MIASLWLMLSSMMYSLQLSAGSFPKTLTKTEEAHYLTLAAEGDLEARNILIERNLRLVAHIMKKYYAQMRTRRIGSPLAPLVSSRESPHSMQAKGPAWPPMQPGAWKMRY